MDPFFSENVDDRPKFSSYEQECINLIESSLPNVESECETEKLNYERKLWTFFQSSAMAIAQLYSRDNIPTTANIWNTFQNASTNVTCLYKESAEYHKKNYDVYHQIGYHKRTKEILNWIKKKKNMIRREELLAFLSNNNTYLHNNNVYFHRYARNSRINRNSDERYNLNAQNSRNNALFILSDSPKSESVDLSSPDPDSETNLETFKEALVSNIRNSAVLISTNANKWHPSWNEDLNEFVDQQYHRHVESRKRISSMDICMDSPNNKRTKFC